MTRYFHIEYMNEQITGEDANLDNVCKALEMLSKAMPAREYFVVDDDDCIIASMINGEYNHFVWFEFC